MPGSAGPTAAATHRRKGESGPLRPHRALAALGNATLVGVLVLTGAVLYWGELSSVFGRRAMFKEIHVIAGLCLPIPFLLSLPGRRGRGLRRDLGALNRFSADDFRWLRSRGSDPTVRLYVAPMYGYKSLKWLQRITLVAQPRSGYWEQQGYDVDAWIGRSNGRSDTPA